MLDRMDIYCLHRDNADIPSGEFIDALNEVRDEGLISYLRRIKLDLRKIQ